MIDIIGSMTHREYLAVKAQLKSEGLWHGGTGAPAMELRANTRAEQIIAQLRK